MANKESKHTLLTNLEYVRVAGANACMNATAVLVTETPEGNALYHLGSARTIRGFGADPANPTFTMWLTKHHFPLALAPRLAPLPPAPYEQVRAQLGSTLALADGTKLELWSADQASPTDVHVQYGDIAGVWRLLVEKTARYWRAPYMPHLNFAPPAVAVGVARERYRAR